MKIENEKFNWFGKIITYVNKYGKSTVAYSVLILFLIINIISNPLNVEKILEKWSNKSEKKHEIGLEKRKQANIIIPNLLDNLRYQSDADRINLFEFHNGGVNSSNLPFYHFSSTYESVGDNIEEVSDQYQKQNASDYATIFDKIQKNRYVYIPDLSQVESKNRLQRKMFKNGVHSYYLCAIYGDDSKLLGVLTITASNDKVLNENLLNRLTPSITQQISNLISGINN